MDFNEYIISGRDDKDLARAINGADEVDAIYRRVRWCSFEAVSLTTREWLDGFKNRRPLEPIGNIERAEAWEFCYALMEQSAMAA